MNKDKILLDAWRGYIDRATGDILHEVYSMKDVDWDLKQCENDLNDRERIMIKLEIYRRVAEAQEKEKCEK